MSERLREIAAANRRIALAGWYATPDCEPVVVGEELEAAVSGTRLYGPAELLNAEGREQEGALKAAKTAMSKTVMTETAATVIEVTAEDTIAAALRLLGEAGGRKAEPEAAETASTSRVAILNFASARNPGGGFLSGAKAQEEDVCRKTLLYDCLLAAPDFYAAHRADRDAMYSSRLIYSPAVPVIRDVTGALAAPPLAVDVITCAAPNAGVVLREDPGRADELARELAVRAGVVLEAAVRNGAATLVLGAWGCGVFRNDPVLVAEAFRARLAEPAYAGAFERIVFAVMDHRAGRPTLDAFRRVLAG